MKNITKQSLIHVAIVVRDYDEAIDFYTKILGFELIEDTYIEVQEKRWVLVSPRNGNGAVILLAKASTEEQTKFIGNQAGGRVFLFLSSNDIWRDYNAYVEKGVQFIREPEEYEYGTAAVFQDLYGNRWDLVEHAKSSRFSQHDA